MLNCKISSGVQSQCETSIGGILKLAFANFSTSNSFTQSTGSCEVDTISLADSEKAYEVSFLDGTGLAATTFNYSSGSKEGDSMGVNAVFEGVQLDAPLKVKDWSVVSALFPTE